MKLADTEFEFAETEDWSDPDPLTDPDPLIGKVRTLHDLLLDPPKSPEYVIEGVLAAGEIVNLSGSWKVGKSWFALDLAHAIADNERTHFLGHEVKKHGPVLYVDAENGVSLFYKRACDLGITPEGSVNLHYLFVRPKMLRLDRPDSTDRMSALADEVKPQLIVFDSLVRFHEQDENSSTGVGRLLDPLAPLRERGISVLVLDHQAKNSNGASRGSGEKQAQADRTWSLGKTDGETVQTGVTWTQTTSRLDITPEPQRVMLCKTPAGRLRLQTDDDSHGDGISVNAMDLLRYLDTNPPASEATIKNALFEGSMSRMKAATTQLKTQGLADYEVGAKTAHLWTITDHKKASSLLANA